MFDCEGNGYISKDDIQAVLGAEDDSVLQDINTHLGQFKDGVISFEEYILMMKNIRQ